MYIEWHDPGEPVATRPCGEGMGVHVFPVLPYIFTNWPGCDDGHGRQKGRERGGRSSRNHSRENKHQIAYAQRPRPGAGGHGPRSRKSCAQRCRFFAADTDSTPTLTIPEPRFAAVGNVSLGSISKGGSRITQNHASSRSRQSDGNPLLSSRYALSALSDSLSRSSLAPSLSN